MSDRRRQRDPYRDEIVRRVAARAPYGLGVFLVCVALSATFEMLRFPERRGWMGGFAIGFVLLSLACWGLVRRRPAWSVVIFLVLVNVAGVAVNAYHVIVGASLAMCVWQLTALLASSAAILPWGGRNQVLACVGILLSYPLHLESANLDPLVWGAGGTYLVMVSLLSMSAASLMARYVRSDLRLTATLSEREARLQSYFDLSAVGTAILSADGRCSEVNDELCRMFGYAREDLLMSSWRPLVHQQDRSVLAGLLRQTLSGEATPPPHELRCVRRDGEVRHAMMSVRGLPGPGGIVDHVMLLVHDVTERRRTEAERERYLQRAEVARLRAEEASRAKDEFLATVSHELRTPLAPILAWANLLRKGQLGPEKMATALAAIEHSAKAQAQLVEDLLDVSRIVSGEWRLTVDVLDLAPVVRRVGELMQPAADAKGVTLEVSVPRKPLLVQGDAERLEQVFWNLVSNGVKFTNPGGRVWVRLERAGANVRFSVRDTGEGIDPAFLPHVFERFRQGDSSATRRHGGLGLGLAIVRTLVDLHQGTARAESPGLGHGATFTVELPAAPESVVAPRGAEHDGYEPPATLGGVHVLVVDDDPASNAVVSELLGSCGVEVRTAGSTAEALEIAARWCPDVVVSDIAMPGDDGYGLLRKMRASGGALAKVPAIALTAYAANVDRTRLLDAGFDAHVAKPFDPTKLTAAVEDAVTRLRPQAS